MKLICKNTGEECDNRNCDVTRCVLDYQTPDQWEPESEYRLGEDKVLEEFENYIAKTYSQHYAGNKKDSRQTIEAIIDRGHGEGFCIGNAMKYLERYGFKNGKNRDDLMKAMHYCLLAIINHDRTVKKDENAK